MRLVAGASLGALLGVTGLPLPAPRAAAPHIDVATVALSGRGTDAGDGAVVALDAATAAARRDAAAPARDGWHARVAMPNDGQMVVLEWDEAGDADVQVRSFDGRAWSDWEQASTNPDEAPDDEGAGIRTSVGPIWVGRGTRQVEIRVANGTLANLRLDALDSVEPRAASSLLGGGVAGASPAQPAIIGRAAWGAGPWRGDNPGCTPAPIVSSPLQFGIVHHTVTSNSYGPGDADDIMRGIYWQHTIANGWCDIAYNFVVDRYGQVFEGRTGSIAGAVRGGHARGFNSHSVGVALLGQYQPGASPPAASVPIAQREGLRHVLAWKFGQSGIDALGRVNVVSACDTSGGYVCKYPPGTTVSLSAITDHRAVTYTSCPGDMTEALLPGLRTDVARDVITSMPYPLSGWAPASTGPALLTLDAYGGLHPAGSAWVPGPSLHWGSWAIARSAVLMQTGGYVLDGWGGLRPFGGAPTLSGGMWWPGWDIARDLDRGKDEDSGYVLDGWGGLHTFGGAPTLATTAYWPGWDIARGVVTNDAGSGGYVLDGWGGLHRFGAAPAVAGGAYWPGWDIARDVALRPDGRSGYVLDGWGGLHAFGGAPPLGASHYTPGVSSSRSLVLTADGTGGWVLDMDGNLWPFGTAGPVEPHATWTGMGVARQVVRL